MKILFCTNTFENVVNGPSKFAKNLLEINRRYSHAEIRILTEDIAVESLSFYDNKVFRLDLKLNFWNRPWGFIYRMFPYYNACRTLREIYNFDIVVFNNAITGIWSAIKLAKPVIGMINDDNSVSVSRKNFIINYKWIRHFIFKHFEKIALIFEAGVIANSHFLYQSLLKNYQPNLSKLHLLHKGIMIDKDYISPLRPLKLPVKILFVKSDFIRGGLVDLINALALLVNARFELDIVGPKMIYKQEILAKNKSSNVKINFIGPASEEAIKKLMDESDFFIVPAHQEALGIANMEALAHGVTVISSNAGGIPEVMDFGKNGWMVQPKNPFELAKTLQYAIENPEERSIKQKNGFDFVRQHFSHEQVMDRFLKILEKYKS
ncbi:glycosyltransferase family 4 protein [Dyadobacter subterraneus]|uniref:Glycosyltransferase family 4 protein n=1 Tax=Dyadobacter subterraneus TaxID=2773304 RepID=A0ABR9WLI1_9BACT|nr:glycosyltransferase family 4 protein [Dyadobacter subterraneus]MBE9466378.1 glycosyltransferase family 4 protein [Dyadobacter subterraneus]